MKTGPLKFCKEQRCDGSKECSDGYDETFKSDKKECSGIFCTEGEYHCKKLERDQCFQQNKVIFKFGLNKKAN